MIPFLIAIFLLGSFEVVKERTLYFCSGVLLESGAVLAGLGWEASLLTPWRETLGNECLLVSHILDKAAERALCRSFASAPSNHQRPSQESWHLNKELLAHIPADSKEEQELLLFLEKHWLAKSSGFYSFLVDQICPCYGISYQVHPETTGFYARNPGLKFPEAYKNRVNAWKDTLPHPNEYPLILTRPSDVQNYLPSSVVDVTALFTEEETNPENWLRTWKRHRAALVKAHEGQKILCVQRVEQEGLGGLRLLPLVDGSDYELEEQHRYLLHWVSLFGLSANRIELDRWPLTVIRKTEASPLAIKFPSREEFAAFLKAFETNWVSNHLQKTLMVNGTVNAMKGLLTKISEEQWDKILWSPTKSALVGLSLFKIQEGFKLLLQNKNDSFFGVASRIELIHSDLSALLEAISPFAYEDFSRIYRELLTTIPEDLKPLTSYGIHSTGMTSLIGIFKSVEKLTGKMPRILYGENSYFENIHAAESIAHASSIEQAKKQDWEEVDLILAQFNPALKRIDFKVTEYHVENVAEYLRKALAKREKPLTLALDCTFDYIDSPRVERLLVEFQEEIKNGLLNVISYKSGLKFDLFGMDNYCGAPFFMIHNGEKKWAPFDPLVTDKALQTDRLSLNWFCLAYKNVAPELELYRKQVFDNTRALLSEAKPRLFQEKNDYRIIPMDSEADLVFIDLKVFGPLHGLRASLIGGLFTIKCLEKGHPIFYRPSVGFYHPNFTIIYGEECTTIRLTLGLDPTQVSVFSDCLAIIDALNGSPGQFLIDLFRDGDRTRG